MTRVAHGEAADVNKAVAAARAAFETGPWRKMTPSERGKVVWRIGDLIEKVRGAFVPCTTRTGCLNPAHSLPPFHPHTLCGQHADQFADLESLDNGKPRAVAKVADVALAADLFHYMAGWATKIHGRTFDVRAPEVLRSGPPHT